jgi:hypothetical protein
MAFQGKLDGLCGPYAIVNALSFCGMAEREEQLFQIACSSPANKRWPDILWEGTTFGDLKKMAAACLALTGSDEVINVSYPFLHVAPASNRDFWIRFDSLFSEESTRCVILRMTKPSDHWIVAYRDVGETRVSFLDSDPYRPQIRKNRTSIFAGDRRRRPSQWLIDRRDVIVFSLD